MALQYGRGLIPARAGNTLFPIPHCPAFGAHPRSRGEHVFHPLLGPPIRGSSPLARGTPERAESSANIRGLIPARAGNTSKHDTRPPPWGAHPRSRGEHVARGRLERERAGSSPLARGTRTDLTAGRRHRGLIPARAGNTQRVKKIRRHRWAHPRSRGEHSKSFHYFVSFLGSSPLARGTLRPLIRRLTACGLIPARAGNTALFNSQN